LKKRLIFNPEIFTEKTLQNISFILIFLLSIFLVKSDNLNLDITNFFKEISFFYLSFFCFILTSRYVTSEKKKKLLPFLFLNSFIFLNLKLFLENKTTIFFYFILIYINLIFLFLLKMTKFLSIIRSIIILLHINLQSYGLFLVKDYILHNNDIFKYLTMTLFVISVYLFDNDKKRDLLKNFFKLFLLTLAFNLIKEKSFIIPGNHFLILILLTIRSYFAKGYKKMNKQNIIILYLGTTFLYLLFGSYIFFGLTLICLTIDTSLRFIIKRHFLTYINWSKYLLLMIYFILYYNTQGIS